MNFLPDDIRKKIDNNQLTSDDFEEILKDVMTQTSEHVLKMIPNVVSYIVKQSSYLKQLSEDFYLKHPELNNHKDLVTKLVQQTETENPGKSFEEILNLVAPKAKQHLKQFEQASDPTTGKSNFNLIH